MPKNIVICCDGTNNQISGCHTNVLKLWETLVQGPGQVVYYDPGVGARGNPDAVTRVGKVVSRLVDLAIGHAMRQNLSEAYTRLMELYQPGDSIFMFGFSRGAYTVRALAGVLKMYGLAHRGHENLVDYIWLMYSADEASKAVAKRRFIDAKEFKKRFSQVVHVQFLGCWDTVSCFGWLWDQHPLPYTAENDHVLNVRHVVSIHERRACFRQNLFHAEPPTDLKEIWCRGVHSDIGGGYPEQESGLAKVTLEWMLREAIARGLAVDAKAMEAMLGGDPDYTKPDPKAAMHRSLKKWWILAEFFPRPTWNSRVQRRRLRVNLFRKRYMPATAVVYP